LLQDANFLLLDEPTNHLDIQSKEVLFRALSQFDGTVLFVSHDHDFVNKLATRVLELTPDGIHSYFGNYESFLEQRADQEDFENSDSSLDNQGTVAQKKAQKHSEFETKKNLQRAERSISKFEAEIEKINASFADFEYGTPEFDAAQEKLTQKEAQLKTVMNEWEKAQK